MNTLNFLQRLQPFLRGGDVALVNITSRLAVVNAINEALTKWTAAAPAGQRQMPGYASFPAPTQVTGISVTYNSRTISGGGFTAADVGKTVILAGDDVPHVLTSTTTLRIPYGGTTGTKTGTLYSDAFPLPAGFENFAGPVWLEAAAERRPLPVVQDLRHSRWFSNATTPVLGDPEGYGIEIGNTVAGTAPAAIMRLYPTPSVLQRLSFDYQGKPQAWTMTDLQAARDLDLADEHWQKILAMTVAELLNTDLLAEHVNPNLTIKAADRAEQDTKWLPPSPHPSPVRLGSRHNW
jgi:hypothetical protein